MVVGVTDEESDLVEKFVGVYKIPYAIVIENGDQSMKALGVTGFPTAFLVDTKGVVVWSGWPTELSDADLETALKGARVPAIKLPPALLAVQKLLDKEQHGKAYETTKAMLAAGTLDAATTEVANRLVGQIERAAKGLAESAGKHLEAKEYFEAVADLKVLSSGYAGLPQAGEADAKLRELQLDIPIRNAIRAGELLVKARELDQAQEYEKAYKAYRTLAGNQPGTKPAEFAKARADELDKLMLIGFDKNCENCRLVEHACPKHRKKMH